MRNAAVAALALACRVIGTLKVQVSAMPSPTQSEPPADALPAVRPADLKNGGYANGRSSVSKRASITLARFLIIFCIGVSAGLAWRAYGDPVREMIASSYPQLSRLMPHAEPVPQNTPDVIGTSPDQRQSNGVTLDLDAVRQAIDRIATSVASSQEQTTSNVDRIATNQEQMTRSLDRITTSVASSQEQITSNVDRIATNQEQMTRSLDRIAASQEQITRSLDHLTADQEQMTREIRKLQEIEQSTSPPHVTSAPKALPRPAIFAPKARPRPAPAPTTQPLSQASQEPTVR
jgi:hypothetical protein